MRRLALLVLSAALALGACGDDDDDATDGADPQASADGVECPVTRAEVSEIVGLDVEGPDAEGAGPGCSFPFAGGTGTVAVRVFRGSGDASHEAFLAAFEDAKELEVGGNDAAWAVTVGTLDLVVGDDGVQVQIVESAANDIPDERAAAIELAELLLKKL